VGTVALNILGAGIVAATAGILLWLLAVCVVRRSNFGPDQRHSDRPIRGETPEIRSGELKYHNEAIYRDFEYFFKGTAALLGGAAYLVVQARTPEVREHLAVLITLTAVLQALTTIAVTLFVFAHQKSKIERWPQRFTVRSAMSWQETAMVGIMWFVLGAYGFGAVPLVLR
jgi:hypothetical protein